MNDEIMQLRLVAIHCSAFIVHRSHAERHAAGLGKLHRIGEEVDQHLAEFLRVSAYVARYCRGALDAQREPLVDGLLPEQQLEIVAQADEVDRGLVESRSA